MKNKQLIWIIIFVLLSLVPFGMYFCIFHGALSSDSNEWANAGTFICGFSALALTALNVYAMFAINNTLQEKQEDQYRESRNFEMFKLKLQIMNDFNDAYKNVHEELAKGKLNTEVIIVNMNRLYQLNTIISKTEGLFPSLKAAKDISHMNELLPGFANALAGVYAPINPITKKAYTSQELIEDLKQYYDFILLGMSDDISKKMNKQL